MVTTVKAERTPKATTRLQKVIVSPKWCRSYAPGVTEMLVRPGSSDTDVIEEVITKRCYRKPSIGVEILPGEHWLDLGANIGAFAVCCYLHGATASCYEPVQECFEILQKNVPWKGFKLCQSAVTVYKDKLLPAWESKNPLNFYRTTVIETPAYQQARPIPNTHVSNLHSRVWDGVKLDIEGSELPIIDEGLLPETNKLALEYHFSRDNKDMRNFHRRMKALRGIFSVVKYPPSLDNIKKGEYPGRFDVMVHCKK